MVTKNNEINEAISILQKEYPDLQINNSKSIGGSERQNLTKEYDGQSIKRSSIKNINYCQCTFMNTAFSDSYFDSVIFYEGIIQGNGFISCNFFDTYFYGKETLITSSNFSHSNFTKCHFDNIIFQNCGLVQTLFHNCTFSYTTLKSNTLEGSRFMGGEWISVEAGNVNIEFVEFSNTTLQEVVFPFYQFPYIIGIADYLSKKNTEIFLLAGKKKISLNEYKLQFKNLVLLYESQSEYFPMCNLLIMQGDIKNAKETLITGINYALSKIDFRMVHYFCRLAQHHNLLDEFTINRIMNILDKKLMDDKIPPERLNDCIIHAGEIRRILLNDKKNRITYNFHVKTNIHKADANGVIYINTLCNELNSALSHNGNFHDGFEIAISNHSPFEIVVSVICAVDSLCSIAQMVWGIVEKHGHNNSTDENAVDGYLPVEIESYQKYINTRIDVCKEQLINLKNKYSGKKLDRHIEEITQELKTDINELYDKDIMIFKKKNT